MKRIELIYQKLAVTQEYLAELERLKPSSWEKYKAGLKNKRAIERQIQLVVEAAVDAGEVMVIDLLNRPLKSRKEVILKLEELKIIPERLANEVIPLISLRNRIVHEYSTIRDKLVFESIKEVLQGTQDFITALSSYLKRSEKRPAPSTNTSKPKNKL